VPTSGAVSCLSIPKEQDTMPQSRKKKSARRSATHGYVAGARAARRFEEQVAPDIIPAITWAAGATAGFAATLASDAWDAMMKCQSQLRTAVAGGE
jgi:hypothetical protein